MTIFLINLCFEIHGYLRYIYKILTMNRPSFFLKVAWGLTEDRRMPQYERAIFAALCGNLSVLQVSLD
jgi:hypothetical protein